MMNFISVEDKLPSLSKDYLILDDKGDMWVSTFKDGEFLAKIDNDTCCTCVCPNFSIEKFTDHKGIDRKREGSDRLVMYWMELPDLPS